MISAGFNPGDKIINPLHKADQEPIPIEDKIARKMKSYQLEGVQFLWRELTGDLDRSQGCLLAHTMGLGKTMQSIALLQCVDFASRSPSANVRGQLPLDLQLGNDRGRRVLRCRHGVERRGWPKEERRLWMGRRTVVVKIGGTDVQV